MTYTIAAVTPQGADWSRSRPVQRISLTAVQRDIYDFIQGYQRMWGATPLYREIAYACELRSTSSVAHQIGRLVQLGVLRKPPRLVRVIRLMAVLVELS